MGMYSNSTFPLLIGGHSGCFQIHLRVFVVFVTNNSAAKWLIPPFVLQAHFSLLVFPHEQNRSQIASLSCQWLLITLGIKANLLTTANRALAIRCPHLSSLTPPSPPPSTPSRSHSSCSSSTPSSPRSQFFSSVVPLLGCSPCQLHAAHFLTPAVMAPSHG